MEIWKLVQANSYIIKHVLRQPMCTKEPYLLFKKVKIIEENLLWDISMTIGNLYLVESVFYIMLL